VIAAAAAAPTAIHLPRLGFYSDDWAFLAAMHLADDQSFWSVCRQLLVRHDTTVRPVQWICLTALYKMFGLQPLGYHVAITASIASGALLLYLCLRHLREPPILVIAVSLLYALLPHYATDRLWIAALQANVSACLFFMSFYADQRALASPQRFGRWKALGSLLLVMSGLAYEVFLPLAIVGAGFLALTHERRSPLRSAVVLGANLLVVTCILIVKAVRATRGQLDVAPMSYLVDTSGTIVRQFRISYGDHVLKIPFTVWQIVREYATWPELVVAAILGAIVVACVRHTAVRTAVASPVGGFRMLVYVAVGILVFVAGFSLFPSGPTMTGINNRTANAASVGVALSLVGAAGCVAHWVSARRAWWPSVFAAVIGALGVSGFLTVNTVTAFWVTSYDRQRDVLAAIRERFPTMPLGSSVMLDGECPWHGPAIVFDTPWDLAGALRIMYGDPDLRADVLHSRVSAGDQGLVVGSYGPADYVYPYGERLFVYHVRRRDAYVVSDAPAAHLYLANIKRTAANDCSPGRHGTGSPVFRAAGP